MKIKIPIFALMMLTVQQWVFAQDAQFSQYFTAPLLTAPSFAGASDQSRFSANYRTQWNDVATNGFRTYSVAYDQYFSKVKSGAGILFFRDAAGSGVLSTSSVYLLYSYTLKLSSKLQFRPGAQVCFTQRSVDQLSLVLGDQLYYGLNSSMDIFNVANKTTYPDFGISALFYSNSYWAGATFDHITNPNQTLMNQDNAHVNRKLSVYAGARLNLKEKLKKYDNESLTFTFLFKTQQNFHQLDFGAYWMKPPLYLGISYRGLPFKMYENAYSNHDAIIALIGVQYLGGKLGYSYDFTISKLATLSGGAHEIAFIYEFDIPLMKDKKKSDIPCPRF